MRSVMMLSPGEEIGLEVHDGHDQFIRIEAGMGYVQLDGRRHDLSDGTAGVIPAGVEHNERNAVGPAMDFVRDVDAVDERAAHVP